MHANLRILGKNANKQNLERDVLTMALSQDLIKLDAFINELRGNNGEPAGKKEFKAYMDAENTTVASQRQKWRGDRKNFEEKVIKKEVKGKYEMYKGFYLGGHKVNCASDGPGAFMEFEDWREEKDRRKDYLISQTDWGERNEIIHRRWLGKVIGVRGIVEKNKKFSEAEIWLKVQVYQFVAVDRKRKYLSSYQ